MHKKTTFPLAHACGRPRVDPNSIWRAYLRSGTRFAVRQLLKSSSFQLL